MEDSNQQDVRPSIPMQIAHATRTAGPSLVECMVMLHDIADRLDKATGGWYEDVRCPAWMHTTGDVVADVRKLRDSLADAIGDRELQARKDGQVQSRVDAA